MTDGPDIRRGQHVDGMAITSMILGILWLLGIGSVLALVMGLQARADIRRTGADGAQFALVGVILGWVGLGVTLLVLFVASGTSGTF